MAKTAKGKSKSKNKKPQKLTAKQEAFCREYIIDHNATAAAIRVGYSQKTAKVTACQNLTKPNLKEFIAELEKGVFERLEITADRVIDEIGKIAFSNIGQIVRMQGPDGVVTMKLLESLTVEQMACIAELTEIETVAGQRRFKVKLHDKLKALELLGKTNKLNLFSNDLNVKLPEGCGVLVAPGVTGKDAWSAMAQEQQKQSQKPK